MTRLLRPARLRGTKIAAATAGLVAVALVGVALAKTFTLNVARHAKVTNQSLKTTTEDIVVNSRGFAVYALTGDSKSHPKCTKASGCFTFWPPLTVSSRKQLT